MTSLDTPAFTAFAELVYEKRRLEAELREINLKIKKMEQPLVNDMVAASVRSISVGDSTVFLVDSVRAKMKPDVERSLAIEAMEAAGLEDLLRYDFNLNTVSAWARELLEDGRELPGDVGKYLDIVQGPELRVRKK